MYKIETIKDKKKHQIIFYDSDKVLPYRRYQKFNKHMMIDLEVGSNIVDYDRRMSRAISYLNNQDSKSAAIELTNQRQCLYNALEGYSPRGMALADQENDLNEILDKLDKIGFTKELLDDTLDHLKKK